jgi:hypothetical protein
MSRWLEAARRAEKSPRPAPDKTDKTDRTEVSSVMSVLSGGNGSRIDPANVTEVDVSDPSDLLDGYLERLAICGEAGDVPDSKAHRIATDQCGASLDELVEQQLQYWRQRLRQLDEPRNPRLKEVVPCCLAVLECVWLHRAVRLGWDERALFGLDPAAPTVVTRNGLVTGLVVTSLPKPLDVVSIAADQALIETASGARVRQFNDGYRAAPIWEDAKFQRLR